MTTITTDVSGRSRQIIRHGINAQQFVRPTGRKRERQGPAMIIHDDADRGAKSAKSSRSFLALSVFPFLAAPAVL
ncbi:hypothetical protein [Komagataeibacter oboediens]|uniref:hypothetical protein n=1 Tax=Komagataeibacter oboediens TaxID=65958 RepID=UPI0020B8E498|nr:hypothetical protein [Komagataeibacter oboediens]MCK9820371.1 hypothetical protein [Komagataeibacter oboediens]